MLGGKVPPIPIPFQHACTPCARHSHSASYPALPCLTLPSPAQLPCLPAKRYTQQVAIHGHLVLTREGGHEWPLVVCTFLQEGNGVWQGWAGSGRVEQGQGRMLSGSGVRRACMHVGRVSGWEGGYKGRCCTGWGLGFRVYITAPTLPCQRVSRLQHGPTCSLHSMLTCTHCNQHPDFAPHAWPGHPTVVVGVATGRCCQQAHGCADGCASSLQ